MSGTETVSKRIRVVIVDDHPVVRGGLKMFLLSQTDVELVGEAGSGEEAVQACTRLQPDVVLMDMVMPGMDGVTAISLVRKACPNTQVIALTSFSDDNLVQAALQAGAIGYLLKNVSGAELVEAIRAAQAGRPTLSPEAAKVLISYATQRPKTNQSLTKRELEVLSLMTEGLSNAEIAETLVVSRSTIKHQVSSILSKLGVSSRTEAVSIGVRDHLVK